VIRQGHLIAPVVMAFVIWCTVPLVVVGCSSRASPKASKKEQGRTDEATTEKTRSPETAASEKARAVGNTLKGRRVRRG
jgi:hypothetical protein